MQDPCRFIIWILPLRRSIYLSDGHARTSENGATQDDGKCVAVSHQYLREAVGAVGMGFEHVRMPTQAGVEVATGLSSTAVLLLSEVCSVGEIVALLREPGAYGLDGGEINRRDNRDSRGFGLWI